MKIGGQLTSDGLPYNSMVIEEKLKILADAAKYDASCASSGSKRKRTPGGLGNSEGMGICHSYTPDGRCVSLLKILLTNFCIYDCSYCINRASSPVARARFKPEEVVHLTMEFYERNYIEGLFLSSGVIKSPDDTMADLVRVAQTLRGEHKFCGYIHLKAVPGASPEMLTLAGKYADRVSANIELAEQKDLNKLAPGKNHLEIETTMKQILNAKQVKLDEDKFLEKRFAQKKSSDSRLFLPAGQSTQIIVGATPSSDGIILKKSSDLYKNYKLKRVYYSAFSPIQNSEASLPASRPPLLREHRLYQADWLLRFYGFSVEELVIDQSNNLDLNIDPKLAWALANRQKFPVDINSAPKEDLLRVPGLGVKNIFKILSARRQRKFRLADLKLLHVPLSRTKYFIQTSDWNPALRFLDQASLGGLFRFDGAKQLELFGTV